MTRQYSIDPEASPENLRAGLAEIQKDWPHRFADSGQKLQFVHEPGPRHLAVRSGEVRYAQPIDAFRALGCLLGDSSPEFSAACKFDMLGVMVDASRNGVMQPQAVQKLLRHMALMGLNTLMLYTEDTYEVAGRPLFGYLRGAYSAEELGALDRYAQLFGIEMFACIQTLSHLDQILQWPAFEAYRDVGRVLLADDDRTYELLGEMVHAASAPFQSHRIHLGMDEAHGLGSGRHRQLFGEQNPFDIFGRHLDRLRGICRSLGLHPMIWSDMYFRLGSKNNDYYDVQARIPAEVAARIPHDVQLVYWDYYHTQSAFYEDWIDRHRALGSEPIMAGGVWTWNRFWPALQFSLTTTEACMQACKKKSLRQAFVTLWGDDGMECNVWFAMPGLQFFAEHGYHDKVDAARVRANFAGRCDDGDFDAWLLASELEAPPALVDPRTSPANVGKALLWQDPLLSIVDPQLGSHSLRAHYQELASKLAASPQLQFPAQLCTVLALKCELRRHLRDAYLARDMAGLRRQVDGDLSQLLAAVEKLWKMHRDLWLQTYKPFGLEVVELRYGGLLARLQSLRDRLVRHLDDPRHEIPELAVELHQVCDGLEFPDYGRLKTPSAIK